MTASRLSGAALLLLLAATGARAQAAPTQTAPMQSASIQSTPPQTAPALRLRPGDGVRLTVRDEPKLSGDYPVVEPGRVLFPEIGIVSVADRPFSAVEEEVREEFGRILVDPEIVVVPLVRVAVLGEVREPGVFPVDPSQTVADLLASAGGVTESANRGKIDLIRDGRITRLRMSPGADELRQRLRSGDQIIVGRRSWIHENVPIVVGALASVLAAATTGLIVR